MGGVALQISSLTYSLGTTTLSSPPVNVGSYTVTAVYSGNTNYTSATVIKTLNIVAASGAAVAALQPGGGAISTLHQLPNVKTSEGTMAPTGPSNSTLASAWAGTSPIAGGTPQAPGLLAGSGSSPTGGSGSSQTGASGNGQPGQGPPIPSLSPLADLVKDPSQAAGLGSTPASEPTLQPQAASGPLANVNVSTSIGGAPDLGGSAAGQQITQDATPPTAAMAGLPTGLQGGGHSSQGNGSSGSAPAGFVFSSPGILDQFTNGLDVQDVDTKSVDGNGNGTFIKTDSLHNYSVADTYTYSDPTINSNGTTNTDSTSGETIAVSYNYTANYDKTTTGIVVGGVEIPLHETLTVSLHESEQYVINPATPMTSSASGETDHTTTQETLTNSFDSYVHADETMHFVSYTPLATALDTLDFIYQTTSQESDSSHITGASTLQGPNGGTATENYLTTGHSVVSESSTETDHESGGVLTGTLVVANRRDEGGSWDDAGTSTTINVGAGVSGTLTDHFTNHAVCDGWFQANVNGNRDSLTEVISGGGSDSSSHFDSGSDTTTETVGPDAVLYTINEPSFSNSTGSGVSTAYNETITLNAGSGETLNSMNSTEDYTNTIETHNTMNVTYGPDTVTGAQGGTYSNANDASRAQTLDETDVGDADSLSTDVTGSLTYSSEQQGSSNFQTGALSLGAGFKGGMGAQLLAGLTSGAGTNQNATGTQNYDTKTKETEGYFGHEDWQGSNPSPTQYRMDIQSNYAVKYATGGDATVLSSNAADIEQDQEKFAITTTFTDNVHDVYSGVGIGATLTTDEITSEDSSETQQGSDNADHSNSGSFTLLGSDVPHPTQPAASSTLVNPPTAEEMGATGTFNDLQQTKETSTVHNQFLEGQNGWTNTAMTMDVTDQDNFNDQDSGTGTTTDSGVGKSDQISENYTESDKGSDQFNYSLSLTPTSGTLTESGSESDTYQESDSGNDNFTLGVSSNDPLNAPATPNAGNSAAGNMQDQENGTDKFQIKITDLEGFTLQNTVSHLTAGVWAMGNVSATLTVGGSNEESDSGSAGDNVSGSGVSDNVSENYKDSNTLTGSVTFNVTGSGANLTATESGSSSDTYSETDVGQEGVHFALSDPQLSLNGNDSFKIAVTGSESMSMDAGGAITIDQSDSETSTANESGGDNINAGTGADAVQDTDAFSFKDQSSSSDSMHVAVSAAGAITGFSLTMSAQDSESASDSGSDSSGGGAPYVYNDSESKTSSASITIASTDGVNFTETDNETDPYIFTHQQNAGGTSPADQQTGYVSVDMSRVLSWAPAARSPW